jgi:hypothetical protein
MSKKEVEVFVNKKMGALQNMLESGAFVGGAVGGIVGVARGLNDGLEFVENIKNPGVISYLTVPPLFATAKGICGGFGGAAYGITFPISIPIAIFFLLGTSK